MHILIATAGSAGDVLPLLAVGTALTQRGHQVELLASTCWQQEAQGAGLGFIPDLGTEALANVMSNPQLWDARTAFRTLWDTLGPQLHQTYASITEWIRPGQTVIVAGTLAFAARLAQEVHGLRGATVHLAPSCLFSSFDTAVRGSIPGLHLLPPLAVGAVLRLVERAYLDPLIGRSLAPLRSRLSLPRTRHVMGRWLHSPDRVIFAFPKWFAAPQRDWPANSVTVGFPLLPQQGALSEDLLRFLDEGPPPLVFTPGTAMAHGRPFFERAIAVTQALGQRAVLVTPYRDQIPEQLPAFVHHAAFAPFGLLAPRAALFVHPGGIGTAAHVLAAGTPQLLTPFVFDQPDNAARFCRLGVAQRLQPHAPLPAWIRKVDGLARDRALLDRCRMFARVLAVEPRAIGRIADHVEALGTDRPVMSYEEPPRASWRPRQGKAAVG